VPVERRQLLYAASASLKIMASAPASSTAKLSPATRTALLRSISSVTSALTRASSYAFDLIELNGGDLRRDPLEVREATLASIVAKASPGMR